MFSSAVLIVAAIAVAGYLVSRRSAAAIRGSSGVALHSLPSYHGAYAALCALLPAIIAMLVWLALQGPIIDHLALASLPQSLTADAASGQMQLYLSEIKSISAGQIFGEPDAEILAAAERYTQWRGTSQWLMLGCGTLLAGAFVFYAYSRISSDFRARHGVERIVMRLMVASSIAAILTTIGIIFSLVFEAMRFFSMVPWYEFFFGLNWEPQIPIREDQVAGLGAFGAVPVFAGTILVAFLALLVAVPVGLFSAIYLSEYASRGFRDIVKPILEILAGIPTVVYGFFAVLTVAPALTSLGNTIGLDVAPNSAIAAGAVMGIMIIPFVSSLSDDALSAVPQSLREGSYGLGATKSETIVNVLLPAALPGIVGGVLLAASRAIGETMIVVMAAGLIANLTANPFEGVTTVTVQIVTLLIGDTAFDSPKTLAAFALGLVLFVATLCLNVIALRIVQKYREKYD